MLFIRLTIHAFLAAALLASIGCDRKPAPSATTREAIPTEAPTPKPAARTDDAASVGAIPTGDMGGSGDSDARVVVPRVDLSRLDASAQAQIQRAQQLVEEAPGSAGRLCELGMQYLAFGFNEAAIECFNGAIDRIPKAREYHYLRGLANESLGNSDAAEADFRATIQLAPDYVAAYVNLGNLLRRRNDTSACDMFEKAHELDPDDVIALCGLAECRANDQQDDAAETLLKRAVELQPENEDAHQALSKLYERRGDAALAKQHLEAARNGRKPVVTNDPIRFELVRRTRSEKDIAREAIEMAESGAVERAAVYLERAITHGIDGAEIHHALGGIYLSQRKFHLALTHLRESVRLAPDAVEMRSSLGRALAETGDLDAAETIFREIIEKT
ncbi:MAG TPA: tetratricopeptide repeat protein, partial [Phycisphaerae bacterium]|nr:tetratricopeptide repeat protein [Phycisphaerae bacterium]